LKLNRIIVALCALALAVPAAVMANGPSGDHGKSGQPHGNSNPNHVSQRCKHQPMVGYNYGGTLDPSSTADAIVINVTHANHFAKALNGTKVTLGADDSHKATFNGANPFTTPGADLSKYTVQVVGKVGKPKKGCTFSNSTVTVKKVIVNGLDSSSDQPTNTQTTTTPQS